MGRYITHSAFRRVLDTRVASLSGEYNAEDIRTIMSDLTGELVEMATVDIDVVAYKVVEADYAATLRERGSVFLPSGLLHKVQNIKAVRERTGDGLKEAKEAVERATAKLYANLADNALKHLALENDKNPCYATREYVDATENRTVLRNLWAAANENVPF